jgi:EmrB/QacA subfamily drug resistance transporter
LQPAETAPTQFTHRQIMTAFSGLMTGMLLAALDQTIVSTALPTIVGELGGDAHLSWVVTAYLLTSTASVPLYGKLSDLYGRRPLFQTAIVLFLAGSLLSGAAQSMLQLIVFRGLQGMGAGGLIALVMVIVGDLIPPRQRGRYQGYIGAVFAVSSIAGPLLGGFFVENFTWRWIFYINLPLGIVAFFLTTFTLKLPARHIRHEIDFLGAGALVAAVSMFLFFALWGGSEYPWSHPLIWALFTTGVLFTILFVLQERRAKEPILPLYLFGDKVVRISALVSLAIGAAMLGGTVFIPFFLQRVRGIDPLDSGLLMIPMMMGVVVASIATGRIISRTGRYRAWPIAGTASIALGFGLMTLLTPTSPDWWATVFMGVLGLGIGMAMQPLVLATQNAVGRKDLGAATSLVNFSRSMGGTFGVAAFGAIFNNALARAARTDTNPLDALADAMHAVFWAAIPVAAIGFVLALFLEARVLKETLHDMESKPSQVLAGTNPSVAPSSARGTVARPVPDDPSYPGK